MEKLYTLCGKCTCDVFSMLLCILGKQIILPPSGNVGHIFLQLSLLSVSAWPALLHLWMPPNTELALPRDTCTHTHARILTEMVPVRPQTCYHTAPLSGTSIATVSLKPRSRTTPHRASLRPGQPCPAVCDPAQTCLTQVHPPSTSSTLSFSTHNSHTIIPLITCLRMDGGLGLTAGLSPPSLPWPSA